MLSESVRRARLLIALAFFAACSNALPWHDAPPPDEVNLSFIIENNLLFLPSAKINGHPGRYFFGSATPRTVLDTRAVPHGATYALTLGERATLPFTPLFMDLHGAGDALIGADVFAQRGVTIDYRAGLLTYQKTGIHTEYMTLFRFNADPAVDVTVDGKRMSAIVDTASPDTLTLPAAKESRGRAHVVVGASDLGTIDIHYAAVEQPRLGNRLLSKFLIGIDYRSRVVGLWRDPRIP
ncbi:MAG TPA: hypothetical protein VH087_03070 [Thermoanaerobaculia bacterium]|jgi:hypothetical protein|nr:hypothetical protein [Thermoanaerobaculia bacterium]